MLNQYSLGMLTNMAEGFKLMGNRNHYLFLIRVRDGIEALLAENARLREEVGRAPEFNHDIAPS